MTKSAFLSLKALRVCKLGLWSDPKWILNLDHQIAPVIVGLLGGWNKTEDS